MKCWAIFSLGAFRSQVQVSPVNFRNESGGSDRIMQRFFIIHDNFLVKIFIRFNIFDRCSNSLNEDNRKMTTAMVLELTSRRLCTARWATSPHVVLLFTYQLSFELARHFCCKNYKLHWLKRKLKRETSSLSEWAARQELQLGTENMALNDFLRK